MAFSGYMIKIGSNIFPSSFIAINSYKATPNQIIDLDSYRDSNGLLHRSTLPHKATKIEFNTPPLTLAQKIEMQSLLPARVKLALEYWNDEDNVYKTGDFYIPDITFEIYRHTANNIWYNPVRIAFIEY